MNLILLTPEQVLQHKEICGPKAVNLANLATKGFNIPNFVTIPTTQAHTINNEVLLDDPNLPEATLYAVRSAALCEDQSATSHAGKFLTITEVKKQDLYSSVIKIIEDAKSKNIDEDKFSVIIQEYIQPDISGVTFTRNPNGSRELLLEYHHGKGEDLVSGSITPTKVGLYWNQQIPKTDIPMFSTAIETWKKIESIYEFAQDIEWCTQKGKLYILQTRPITTICKKTYAACLYADANMPLDHFYYQKTEISEIAPRPTPLTLSILQMIYAPDGPVQNAYSHFGITYKDTKFLTIVGNQLFIDKEKEIQSLLPAYGYGGNSKPKPMRLTGMIQTLQNLKALQKIDAKKHIQPLYEKIQKELLLKLEPKASPRVARSLFMEIYELIMQINIVATAAMEDLKKSNTTKFSIAELLLVIQDEKNALPDLAPPIGSTLWKGNALEMSDETNFFYKKNKPSLCVDIDSQELLKKINTAQNATELREYGRWLTAKLINWMREICTNVVHKDVVYFVTLKEICAEEMDISILPKRKEEYEKYNEYSFPSTLRNIYIEDNTIRQKGISAGIASGTVVTKHTISEVSGPKILWTPTIEPNLVNYFEDIEGIISEKGGLLSHLAIVAREYSLPVVVGYGSKYIGKKVTIDGACGSLEE